MPDFNPDPNAFPLKRFPFPWRAVHLPVVPAVFDNSLSLLEVCQKMLHWLNQTIEQMNALHADILALKEYVDSQDAATLAAANAYAVALRDALKEYVDSQDAATLASAQAYADTQDAAILALAKAYADGLYNSLKQYVDTQDAATLASAKAYADGLVSTLRAYVDAQLALKQDKLTFDDLPTTGSNNPVTSNGIAAALTSVQNLIGILRDDFETAIAGTRYDWTITDSTAPALPSGVTYTTINNAAVAGKVMRVTILDTGVICNYVGNGTYLGYHLGDGAFIVVNVTLQNTVRINVISSGAPV